MGRFFCFLLGILLITAPALAASPSDQYLSLRRSYPPRPGLTLDVAAQNPEGCRGMTLEIEGRLLGTARGTDGASLMVSTAKNGTLVLEMSALPTWLQSGDRLRALVAVGGREGTTTKIGMPDLVVVAVASASDIRAAEMRWQATVAARQARERQNRETGRRAAALLARPPAAGKASPSASRPALDARVAALSRSFSPDIRAVYAPYRAAIRSMNRKLSEREVDAITSSILVFSEQMDVDPRLVIAVIIAESSFNPNVTSHKGAMGLGQLMPEEARKLGLTNPYDPVQNIGGAVYLLKGRLDKYSGGASKQNLSMRHIILALASYNAGMGAVKRYGGVPPYRETRNYVRKVEQIYRRLCGGEAPS